MIIFLILLILLIGNVILFIRSYRKNAFELLDVPFSIIMSMILVISANIISFIIILSLLLKSGSLEKSLNKRYETLIKNIDNPYAISDIIEYNEEVTRGKYYLSNPWTSWYVEPAYRDAKIIEIQE